ncbi:fungal-specific transcription factor domain-containing protein [Lineolata rhizophorae]|uniref:Fungal-specific transcription factor domain-containing protein n=1 Tax=Lineolata rhizophorae TaxID=578093 RepID=A0A6A6P743_9PEZI|nr:fungal-specific transcription factor domain-containing protein [Lineolata rhizophorae]
MDESIDSSPPAGQTGLPTSENVPIGSSSPPPTAAAASAARRGQSAALSAVNSRIRRRNRLITSCLECRRRKLKCDKQQPCANCVKFARECVFLGSSLDPAAQLRLAEIKEKMGTLERTLEEDVARKGSGSALQAAAGRTLPAFEAADSGDELNAPEDEKDLEPTPMAVMDAAYYEDADDDLMDLGVQFGKMRITERIGGYVRPKFTEEVNELPCLQLKRALDFIPEEENPSGIEPSSSGDFLGPGHDYIAPASSFYFVAEPKRATLRHYLPSKVAADRLLKQYWLAVHPIAHTMHKPSFERQYASFWNQVSTGVEPPFSFQAVILAALLSAAISMPENEVLLEFGVAKQELVENFREGTETALARANFLRTTKLETLQAFVMYLIPLCRSEVSRAHSALTGTAIRLAECMGLHRDGSYYGLTPVEVHIRRLIWYHLCWLDIRTCEASGPRPQIRREDFDTEFPLNVDDDDLEASNPPTKDADRFTDMTLTRVRFECNEMHRMIWVERPRVYRKKTTLTSLLRKVQTFLAYGEKKFIPLIDESIPVQFMTLNVFRVLTRRMHIMVLHTFSSNPTRIIPERLRQIILGSGLGQLEHAITVETEPILKKWAWFAGALQQYHTALLLLGELYAYPDKPDSREERIWRCLEYVFELPREMTTIEKSRAIMAGIRERTEFYQSFRKMRAPRELEERFKNLRHNKGYSQSDAGSTSSSGQSPATAQRREVRKETMQLAPDLMSFNGVANGEALFAPPLGMNTRDGSDTSSSVMNPQGPSPNIAGDDMMLDIDWVSSACATLDTEFPLTA